MAEVTELSVAGWRAFKDRGLPVRRSVLFSAQAVHQDLAVHPRGARPAVDSGAQKLEAERTALRRSARGQQG